VLLDGLNELLDDGGVLLNAGSGDGVSLVGDGSGVDSSDGGGMDGGDGGGVDGGGSIGGNVGNGGSGVSTGGISTLGISTVGVADGSGVSSLVVAVKAAVAGVASGKDNLGLSHSEDNGEKGLKASCKIYFLSRPISEVLPKV
jgi:hypothetical protein